MSHTKEMQREYVEKVWKVLREDPFKDEEEFFSEDRDYLWDLLEKKESIYDGILSAISHYLNK